MAKILLAGEICAERQYFVDKIPSAKEVSIVNKVNSLTSSKIINAGRILASENSISIFGVVGKDDNGSKALSDLEKYGINSKLVYTTNEVSTAEVLVITNIEGQSAITLNLAAVNYFDESKLKDFSNFDYLYMATSINLDQIYKMIEKAKTNDTKVFLDFPNQQREFDKRKLETVEFVVPNRQEAELLLDMQITNINESLEAVKLLKSFTSGTVIITLDADGCVVFAKGGKEPEYYSTENTKVIDETGSGDIFRGVFLGECIKTNNVDTSVKRALELASESVKYEGVDNSIQQIKATLSKD